MKLGQRVIPLRIDCKRIPYHFAHDLAEAIVAYIVESGRDMRVYLGADGVLGYESLGKPEDSYLEAGMLLVGSYNEDATIGEIRADLMAMQREGGI